MFQYKILFYFSVIYQVGLYAYKSGIIFYSGGNKCTIVIHMKRIGFNKPDMAVNSRTFIEPSFFHGNICTYGYYIVPVIIQVAGEIIPEAAVTAGFNAEIMSIYPYD